MSVVIQTTSSETAHDSEVHSSRLMGRVVPEVEVKVEVVADEDRDRTKGHEEPRIWQPYLDSNLEVL